MVPAHTVSFLVLRIWQEILHEIRPQRDPSSRHISKDFETPISKFLW